MAERILVVDDDKGVREALSEFLISLGYTVVMAENGEEALRQYRKGEFDVIMADLIMPNMDGMELLRRIRDTKNDEVIFLMITGHPSIGTAVEAINRGADDYITKPFSPKYLEARIRNLVEQRKRLKKKFSDKIYVKPKDITLNSLDESFLQKIIETIDQNMNNSEYNIEDMCKDIGMSRMQLYRKLKAITGLSANELIRTQRLQRAAQLLEQDVLNISQITYEVGFNDLKYFRSRFQEHFGMTPSDYIKKHKKTENSM